MIPCKSSKSQQVTITAIGGERAKLTPCTVAIDGNEFYVYASMAIYGRHDGHTSIRENVWDLFCQQIFGCRLAEVVTPSPSSGDLYVVEGARSCECFVEWLRLVSPNPEETALSVDLRQLGGVLADTVRNNAMEQFTPPTNMLVSSLLAQSFGIGVVIYDVSSSSSSSGGEQWEPIRVWHPKPNLKCLHLMQRGRILEMLLHTQKHISPLKHAYPIPTRVISSLPNKMRDTITNTPWDGDIVARHGVYSLDAYNNKTRKNLFIAHFISPETRINPNIVCIHYLPVDVRLNTQDMNFFIGGCDKKGEPIFVYASRHQRGKRIATLIAFWDVDYCCPQICLENTDDSLVIVPCADARSADQIITTEYQCQLYTRRPNTLTIDTPEGKK